MGSALLFLSNFDKTNEHNETGDQENGTMIERCASRVRVNVAPQGQERE
jgi:hypothetical protein